MNIKKRLFIGFVGNFLEHYDHALYGFLAPVLANIFLFQEDYTSSLLWIFMMYPLALLPKIIGSVFFGFIGDTKGAKKALSMSLNGMAIVTVCIGLIPSYQSIGIIAPFLLFSLRLSQSFFTSSETVGGAIFLLEEENKIEKNILSSVYDMSSIAGIFLASFLISIFSYFGILDSQWRVLFFIGAITAYLGYLVRRSDEISYKKKERSQNVAIIPFCAIVAVSGLSHAIYNIIFVFMNGWLSTIASINISNVFMMNNFLLVLDFVLLPVFGFLASKHSKEKIMAIALFCICVFSLPLFALLQSGSLMVIFLVRVLLVIAGVSISAPFYHWAISITPKHARFKTLGLAYVIGSQIIGKSAPAVSLFLFSKTKWVVAPGIYLLAVALIASLFLMYLRARQRSMDKALP